MQKERTHCPKLYKDKSVRKQKRSVLIFNMLTRLSKEEKRLRIIILVQITNAKKKTRTEQAFIDNSTEKDCIKQALAVKYK